MKRKSKSYLLILSCSKKKRMDLKSASALEVYDGVNFRVLRKFLLAKGWPTGLQIKIVSAKYGLIDATNIIEPYNLRMTKESSQSFSSEITRQLKNLETPDVIFVNMGKDYMPAIEGLDSYFQRKTILYAQGPIGKKMKAMKNWLESLPNEVVSIKKNLTNEQQYLYFFPDWDDFIYEPFTPDETRHVKGEKTYAYEACGNKIPFDGVLLSLSHLLENKGALYHNRNEKKRINLIRENLRIPAKLLIFGDCGAFSYVSEENPPFTVEQAADLYDKYDFDIGASVDHIAVPEIEVEGEDGTIKKVRLTDGEKKRRMYLTRDNALKFLRYCRKKQYRFTPIGVIQGLSEDSYVEMFHEYLKMGYEHIALGGLVPRSDGDILKIICAIRNAAQSIAGRNNIWLHLFGILRPKLQYTFRLLGFSSFDSASYYRKAWLRSDQNYLAPTGDKWYGTIRIPLSNSKNLQKSGLALPILKELEKECLEAIRTFDGSEISIDSVLQTVDNYGTLLLRKTERNHFEKKHAKLLLERPWAHCDCPFCKELGVNIAVFRGANRNKRRGFHNIWVFYHKCLNKT